LASVTLDEELNNVRLPDVLPVTTISWSDPSPVAPGWSCAAAGSVGAAEGCAAGVALLVVGVAVAGASAPDCCASAGAHVSIALPASSMTLGN